MFRSRIFAITLIAVAGWGSASCPASHAQQNQGNQGQAAESRNSGPFRGGFLRRLREDLRNEEEARAAKEKEREKAAANRQNREPTPAQRPNSGEANGGVATDRLSDGSGRLPHSNAPGFRLSDSGVLPLPGSPLRAPDEAAERLPAPPRQGFGLVLADRDENLFVQTVEPGGNAAEAGLRRGDQVVQLGGIEVHSIAEFDEITGIMKPGDQIDLVFSREGEKSTIQLQSGSPPPLSDESEGPPLVAGPEPDSPAPDFVPGLTPPQEPALDHGSAMPAVGGVGPSVLQQQSHNSAPGVEQLQQTVIQQQQVIRQLQQDVESLRRQLQATSRPQADAAPRNSQSSRRRN